VAAQLELREQSLAVDSEFAGQFKAIKVREKWFAKFFVGFGLTNC